MIHDKLFPFIRIIGSNLKISWSCGQCSMSCKRHGHGCWCNDYSLLCYPWPVSCRTL